MLSRNHSAAYPLETIACIVMVLNAAQSLANRQFALPQWVRPSQASAGRPVRPVDTGLGLRLKTEPWPTIFKRPYRPHLALRLTAGRERGTSMIGLGALFGLLYFVQGIVEPTDGLLSQPIKSLLRNWGYSAASTAWFISVLSIAWAIKPLYGLLTDFVPLAGSRRRSYLLPHHRCGIYQLDGGVSFCR